MQYKNSEAILFTVIVTGLSVKKKDIYICYYDLLTVAMYELRRGVEGAVSPQSQGDPGSILDGRNIYFCFSAQ